MSAQTKPIDVLAVMDRAAESAQRIIEASNGDARAVIYQADLFKARAAIAELIEADKECDAISAELRRIDMAGPRHGSYGTGWELRDRAHRKEVEARFDAAYNRRSAALANVSGGAA